MALCDARSEVTQSKPNKTKKLTTITSILFLDIRIHSSKPNPARMLRQKEKIKTSNVGLLEEIKGMEKEYSIIVIGFKLINIAMTIADTRKNF
ncbi:hypothetical protein LBMAG33_0970 [Candidatus Levyibacteriota bacterium]|nr:hypothetical protein LBMAG33_0970 [Candidatus Levybacteria bacterium]